MVKENIDRFCFRYKRKTPPTKDDDGLLDEQILTENDWGILQDILERLAIFDHATARLQSAAKMQFMVLFGRVSLYLNV